MFRTLTSRLSVRKHASSSTIHQATPHREPTKMCKELPEIAPKARTPKSPWRRLQREYGLMQPLKPRLSRKIIPSIRVNLNSYWSKFAEVGVVTFDVPRLGRSCLDNEINENLANEIRELGN